MPFRRLDEFEHFPVCTPRGPKRTWVYALVDQRDNTVRYIGVSVSPVRRLEFHLRNPCNENLRHWFESLRTGKHPPPIAVKLAEVCNETWEDAEKAWIRFFRKAGELYNIHEGGRQHGGGGKPMFFGAGHTFKIPQLPKKKQKKRIRSKPVGLSLSEESDWYRKKTETPSKSRGNASWRSERQRMLDRISEARRRNN